jgi:SEC-C motif-containing protein
MSKPGRNDPCPCGSGKKYKKCHGFDERAAIFGPFGTGPLEQTATQRLQKNPEAVLASIAKEREQGSRPLPSSTVISIGNLPPQEVRNAILDACARLVDQNWAGRSEMCIYFAVLARHGLNVLGYGATVESGKGRYTGGDEVFEWDHAWVRTEAGDIVDGNVDSMPENPFVPASIHPKPYWGPADTLPADRKFLKMKNLPPERDEIELDAREISTWKADLEAELKRKFNRPSGPETDN